MKRLSHVLALSLALAALSRLPAAAAPRAPAGPSRPLTDAEVSKKFGEPSKLYLDGKGTMFVIYTLKRGRRMMFKRMPDMTLTQGALLPFSWEPPQGWRELKWLFVPRLYAGPLVFRPLLPAVPDDRYHPGVKLLGRSGQE